MKFVVSRTSIWGDEQPCDEARRDKIVRVDVRTFSSPEEFDSSLARIEGKWYSVGSNHRIDKDGCIARDFEMIDVWTIDINSLNELLVFCDKYGDVIIQDCMWNDQYKEIEIYDDYKE